MVCAGCKRSDKNTEALVPDCGVSMVLKISSSAQKLITTAELRPVLAYKGDPKHVVKQSKES